MTKLTTTTLLANVISWADEHSAVIALSIIGGIILYAFIKALIEPMPESKEDREFREAVRNRPKDDPDSMLPGEAGIKAYSTGEEYEDVMNAVLTAVAGENAAPPICRVLIPQPNDPIKAELDLIVPTKWGVLCIECKNKHTLVDQASFTFPDWYMRDGGSFQNPFQQNEVHINALQHLMPQLKYINVVSINAPVRFTEFTDRFSVKGLLDRLDTDNAILMRTGNPEIVAVKALYKLLESKLPVIYTEEEVRQIYDALLPSRPMRRRL